jgi:hypothetical protein
METGETYRTDVCFRFLGHARLAANALLTSSKKRTGSNRGS